MRCCLFVDKRLQFGGFTGDVPPPLPSYPHSPSLDMDGEIQWTDDSIRWDGGLRVKTNNERLDEEEKGSSYSSDDEEYIIDPFKDANPFELFSFHFEKTSPAAVIIDDATCPLQEGDREFQMLLLVAVMILSTLLLMCGMALCGACFY